MRRCWSLLLLYCCSFANNISLLPIYKCFLGKLHSCYNSKEVLTFIEESLARRQDICHFVVENNPSMLHFYGGAVVNEEGSDDNTIPRYIFEFVNFNDLAKHCRKEVLAGWFIKILN